MSNNDDHSQAVPRSPEPRAHVLPTADRPPGSGATLNPFVVVNDAAAFIEFVVAALGGNEVAEARTPLPDGTLIHAEITLGDAHLLIVDQLDGWPRQPGLLQLWVDDVATTLDDATTLGARIVTPATPFYAETTIGRMADPWGNLWWLYNPAPGQPDPLPPWEGGDDVILRTIDSEMRSRGHDTLEPSSESSSKRSGGRQGGNDS